MKNISAILLLTLTNFAFAQFPSFKAHQIGVFGDRMGQTALVDLDEDGDLDWIFGNRGKMWWYEYQDADRWVLHNLGEGAKTDVGGCAADFNNDGKIDFMVGSGWYENTGSPQSASFNFHLTQSISCHDNVIADINSDGIMDVISNSNDTLNPYLAWYKLSENPFEEWKETIISEGIHGGVDPKGAADLDNDGDIDIVRGDSWFENLSGDGLKWEKHADLIPEGGSRAGMYGLALKAWITDLDNDGDQDIVEAECDISDTRVFWWENRNNGEIFKYHLVSANSTMQDFHSLAVADFDNDGDEDIFSGGGPMSQGTHKWYIWENLSKDGQSWKEHLILEGYRCHEAKAADVDGDGDIDICSKPWHGNIHVFLENKISEKPGETPIWAKYEISLTSSKTYNNPIYELKELKTIFISPSGRSKTVRGFWDGGTDWKIRFQPDELGMWTWKTFCSDIDNQGLHLKSGEFNCVKNDSKASLDKHGAIVHEAGKYYLSYNDGTPFFWLACTAWNGALKSTDEEWGHYLSQRKKNNYNVIQLVTTEWRGCDKNAEGLTAIEGTESIKINPEFFKRIDRKIDEANAKGFVVSPVVLWALPSGEGSQLNPGVRLPINEAVILANYIVARYQGNQVVWTLGGDGRYINELEQKWKEIGRRVFNDIDHAPVTLHPQGSSWIGNIYNQEDWYDLMGYQSSHDNGERVVNWINKGPMSQMWKKLKPMPYINMEPNYEEIDFKISAEDVRNASYWSIFSTPIAGVTYGANGIWPWLRSGEKILNHHYKSGVTDWRKSIEFPGSIQMGYLSEFIQQFEWWNLYPANEILAKQPGEEIFNHWISVVKSSDSELIIAYIPHKTKVKFFNPNGYRYSAKWFNPVAKKYSDAKIKQTAISIEKDGNSKKSIDNADNTKDISNTIEFTHDFETDMLIILQRLDK